MLESSHRTGGLLVLSLTVAFWSTTPAVPAAQLDYRTADARLRARRIDQSPEASFVAVRADASGRLFVGGREALFVYEPTADGQFARRRELVRFPPHSWIFDILVRGDDLYVATASAVYHLPGAVTPRDRIEPRRLLWGQPLGHLQLGLFGLAWGPEGDLYVSLGDPLQHYGDFQRPDHWGHWTFLTASGAKLPYTGVGGVLRCRPDGSRLQIVARGIFRPCGLAFDGRWNLFTNDNDREAMPALYVPARLLHVQPQANFGWPRGWSIDKTPDRADLVETVYSGLGRDAPVGLAYYDEPLLPSEHRKCLLLCRWASRAVSRLTLKPQGTSFRATEHPFLVGSGSARPVGICVGPDGRVFVTILQMPQLEGSPVCPSELVVVEPIDWTPPRSTPPFDPTTATPSQLWESLGDPGFCRRRVAHAEILRRGGAVLRDAGSRLRQAAATSPAFVPLLWLAGASGGAPARERLLELAKDRDAAIREQAVRVLVEFGGLAAPESVFDEALSDPSAMVRRAAVVAYFDRRRALPWPSIAAAAGAADTFERQAACLVLAERAELRQLEQILSAPESAKRLAGVLAAGFRLTLPPATRSLPKHLPLSPYPDSACVLAFADGTADLRRYGPLGNFTTAEHWHAGRHTAEQEVLFTLLMRALADVDERVRLQAAHFLYLLDDPRSEPLVARLRRESDERRLAAVPVSEIRSIRRFWVAGPFPDGTTGFARSHPPESGPIDLTAEYPSPAGARTWQPMEGSYLDFRKTLGAVPRASCYAYCRIDSPVRQRILLFAGTSDGVKIWHNGRVVWENAATRPALQFEDAVLLELEPGGNELLVRVQNAGGDWGMFLHYKALGEVSARLPEKLGTATLAERLRSANRIGPDAIPPEIASVDWSRALARADRERGRKLFGAEALGCAKCHTVGVAEAGGNGPSLAQASKRFTVAYLVESILLPNQSVAPTFRASLVLLKGGETLTGLVVGETLQRIELLQSDGSRRVLAKDQIEARRQLELSPMPAGIVKTADELRDLLAYLLGE